MFHFTFLCLAFSNVEEPIDLQLFDVSRMKPRTASEHVAAHIYVGHIIYS